MILGNKDELTTELGNLFHHSSIHSKSFYKIQLLSSAYIGLYDKQSSANKLQEDTTQLGKSLIYTKNNSGPRTVP